VEGIHVPAPSAAAVASVGASSPGTYRCAWCGHNGTHIWEQVVYHPYLPWRWNFRPERPAKGGIPRPMWSALVAIGAGLRYGCHSCGRPVVPGPHSPHPGYGNTTEEIL
jgi:hypothetical protein